MTGATKIFSHWQLILWDPTDEKDELRLGDGNWWIPRFQGRFFDFYLHAN